MGTAFGGDPGAVATGVGAPVIGGFICIFSTIIVGAILGGGGGLAYAAIKR